MNISFKDYKHNPAIIQLALLLYLKYPLSLRQVEDLLFERGIDITHDPKSTAEHQNGQIVVE